MADEEGLEDGDGLDDINASAERQSKDEEFAAAGDLPRVSGAGPGSAVSGQPIKRLADERWQYHLDDPHVARDILRRAKAGDDAAKQDFYRAHHKLLLQEAGQAKHGGPPFAERLSAAQVGFWEAFQGFNLGRNNGFYAYAIKRIRGEIFDCVTDWHYRGQKDESRAARKDRSDRPIQAEYNGVEGSHYDMEGIRPISAAISGVSSSDDHELRQCDGSGGKVTDAAWDRIVAGRAVPTSWPGRGPPEPCKPITRERYATDQATAHVFDTAAHVRQKLSLRLASMARSYRVPRECMGVDENPNLNGGRYPTKAKFPTREIFSETTTLKLKDGSQRKVVRQKAAGKLGKFAASTGIPCGDHEDCRITRTLYEFDGLPLYPKKRPRGWQGPELPLYLKWNPTPARHQASPRGDAPPSVIDQWADTPVQSRVRETNQPLKEMRRLATIGRQKYADELVAKDRTKARVNNEIEPAPFITRVAYWISDNTAATAAPVDTERRPQGARTAKTDTQYEWDYPAVVSKKPASKPQHIYTEAIFAHARAKFAGKLRPIPQRDPYRWVELVGGGSVRTVPRNNLDRLAQMAERTNHEKPQRNEPALCGVSLPRIDTGDSPHLWPGHRTSGEPDSVGDDGRHGPRRSSDVQDAH